MKVTKVHMDEKPELAKKINSTLVEEGEYHGTVDVKSMLQYCYEDIGVEAIKAKVTKSLAGMKLACYYGCLLTRPRRSPNSTHRNTLCRWTSHDALGAKSHRLRF